MFGPPFCAALGEHGGGALGDLTEPGGNKPQPGKVGLPHGAPGKKKKSIRKMGKNAHNTKTFVTL